MNNPYTKAPIAVKLIKVLAHSNLITVPLLLLTVCIAEVGIFEIRPPGCDVDLSYDDEIKEIAFWNKSSPQTNVAMLLSPMFQLPAPILAMHC